MSIRWWLCGTNDQTQLIGQRIGPQLEVQPLAHGALPGLGVKHRSSRVGRPKSLALPSSLRIVDAAVEALGEESDRIGYAQGDPLAVRERHESILAVAGRDRNVLA